MSHELHSDLATFAIEIQRRAAEAAAPDQLALAQRDNTRLIARIVELEHERDSARRWAAAWREGTARKRGECAYWKTEAMRRSRITDRYIETMAARNNALATRIVDLEHERDAALTTIRIARQRLYDAHGSVPEKVAEVIRAVGRILRRDDDPAETPVPPPISIGYALSSVASQLAVMMIQKRIDAGHPITFAGDAPPTQEGGDDE